jgi:hypothetical protein
LLGPIEGLPVEAVDGTLLEVNEGAVVGQELAFSVGIQVGTFEGA